MYDQFLWTKASAHRNRLTIEYEPLQPFFLFALAEKAECGVFLDIGANVGVYSLFSTLVPTVQRVVAFEANPETFDELKANVELNGLGNVIQLQEKAVSSTDEPLNFGVVSKLSGANSVIDTSIHDRARFHKKVTVEAIALDQFLTEPVTGPMCIKIDVEGHEGHVIEGAIQTLSDNKGVIQLEGYEKTETLAGKKLMDLGYCEITQIGPDSYFSNLESLRNPSEVIAAFEQATQMMIAHNHRNKSVALRFGDVALHLSGRSATIARSLAKRFAGKQL